MRAEEGGEFTAALTVVHDERKMKCNPRDVKRSDWAPGWGERARTLERLTVEALARETQTGVLRTSPSSGGWCVLTNARDWRVPPGVRTGPMPARKDLWRRQQCRVMTIEVMHEYEWQDCAYRTRSVDAVSFIVTFQPAIGEPGEPQGPFVYAAFFDDHTRRTGKVARWLSGEE
jgi:hypothetical protein